MDEYIASPNSEDAPTAAPVGGFRDVVTVSDSASASLPPPRRPHLHNTDLSLLPPPPRRRLHIKLRPP